MSLLKTTSPQEQEAEELDLSFIRISELVCEHGPTLLTLGMKPLEANKALIECIESLVSRVRVAERNSKDDNALKSVLLKKIQAANRIVDRICGKPPAAIDVEVQSKSMRTLIEEYDLC